jgi:signal transduction histidine kinase
MEDLSLHILDIVENAIRAKAKHVNIRLTESEQADLLTLEISDDGEGMDEQQVKRSTDPFFTTKSEKRTGLGLAFLAQSAQEAEGRLEVSSAPGKGTTVLARFKRSHIDRKPLGDVEETVRCLKATHPEVQFSFEHSIEEGIEHG